MTAVPTKRYRGRLRQITPIGDRTRATVKVKVEILDPDDKLFPELAATVHFLPDKNWAESDAIRSFLFVPTRSGFSRRTVTTAYGCSTANSKVVETSNRSRQHEQRYDPRGVRALNGRQKVVLSPPRGLRDGDVVREASR